MAARPPYHVIGNWKMNKTHSELESFLDDVLLPVKDFDSVRTVVCPPFTLLESASKQLELSHVKLGAQNMYPKNAGAFTGEISAQMLRGLHVDYVILGHSERRSLLNESDGFIATKVQASLKGGLRPILCIGETQEQRECNACESVLLEQLKTALEGLSTAKAKKLLIAYEPVWAIGSGESASPEQAQQAHAFIRKQLAELFGPKCSSEIPILYGGSVQAKNALKLFTQPDIDGGLIGGASLKPLEFAKIVEIANQAKLKSDAEA